MTPDQLLRFWIAAIVGTKHVWRPFPTSGYPLATTAAVFAELFHFLDDHPQRIADAWRTLRSGAITVLPITDDDMPSLEHLMKQYADRPMDFADATLVHLAKREALSTIFTIDHDDFETYRIDGRRKIHIVPSR